MAESENIKSAAEYRVLARKYRPQNFDQLIGQDALVRTLRNAIESGRIAHAFMLTGVRGVGKTTTARIIAKALNYTGPDGQSGPTTGPTDDCQICRAISEDRHPDVIEMDAASRTGVDDIREILDGVRYAPTQARYKVYIIDEVHMLSKNAFNALLKTLEEPPAHVKFIFATTEIRKVPITVLSRCQRFDLRRVDVPTLAKHFHDICEKEGVQGEEDAIALIARAADGSVRDGLSLLDQAIALAGDDKTGAPRISAGQVQDMLGLADRARTMDLLERALDGDMPGALSIMDDLYRSGADPAMMIQDLLDLTHILTKLRAVPGSSALRQAMAPDEALRAQGLSEKLSMPTLGKTWQILLKGLKDVQNAPNSQSAAEMVLIRLVYAADLPDPQDLLKRLKDSQPPGTAPVSGGGLSAQAPARETIDARARAMQGQPGFDDPGPRAMQAQEREGRGATVRLAAVPAPAARSAPVLKNLQDVIAALEEAREMILAGEVRHNMHLVRLEPGRLEFRPAPQASPRLAQDLSRCLSELTGTRWMVSISSAPGAPTLAQQDQSAQEADYQAVLNQPLVSDILALFPGAELVEIMDPDPQN